METLIPNEDKTHTIQFAVKEQLDKACRIDAYLGKRFQDYSRSFLQGLIKKGNVLVDGKKVKASSKIHTGQEIVIILPELEPLTIKPEKIDLDILYEDDDIAIINKQSDLVIHPSRGNLSGTLVNGLVAHFQSLSDCTDVYRPGIVHRLDKYTTGVMLIAKNNQAHAKLSQQFADRVTRKEYIALVNGELNSKQGSIELPIGVDPRNRERMTISHGGKKSITHYRVIARYPAHTLVRVFPKTGRTHQIRVHMKAQGHPLVADHVYSDKDILTMDMILKNRKSCNENVKDECLINRQALHARSITFYHPKTNKEMTQTAPLAKDFIHTLEMFQKFWPCYEVAELCKN